MIVGGESEDAGSGATPEIGRLMQRRARRRRRRRRRVLGPAPAQRAAALLPRGRRVRDDAVVRAVRHHAGGGDGVRAAGDRLARRRHPAFGRGWTHRLPGRAARSRSARAPARAGLQRSRGARPARTSCAPARVRALHVAGRFRIAVPISTRAWRCRSRCACAGARSASLRGSSGCEHESDVARVRARRADAGSSLRPSAATVGAARRWSATVTSERVAATRSGLTAGSKRSSPVVVDMTTRIGSLDVG